MTPERLSGAQSDANTDALTEQESKDASLTEPIDSYAGTLKEEFEEIRQMIRDHTKKLKSYTKDYSVEMHPRHVELEGITKEMDFKIEKHRHHFEIE